MIEPEDDEFVVSLYKWASLVFALVATSLMSVGIAEHRASSICLGLACGLVSAVFFVLTAD